MADYEVTRSGKDRDGDITRLCGSWGRREKQDAIRDIEMGTHSYHVYSTTGTRLGVRVVIGSKGKYLRTDPDRTTRNNLDDLPDC